MGESRAARVSVLLTLKAENDVCLFVCLFVSREQLWRREFVDLSIVWLDVLAKQLTQWVLISLSEDEVRMEEELTIENSVHYFFLHFSSGSG